MAKNATPHADAPHATLLGLRLSTATMMFHTAVADRLGLGATDARGCAVLAHAGPLTAGALAERLGITTGAVTGLVDRLARAKLVRRAPDATDRRRVIVELVPNRTRDRAQAELMAPMGTRIHALLDSYGAREREAILGFLTNACEVLEDETRQLTHEAASAGPRRT